MAEPLARFKEMCLDVAPGSAPVGQFWADLGGLEFTPSSELDGAGDLTGAEEGMGIALCPVPEHKTVKNRVHLDVLVSSLDDVVARGGTVGTEHERWTECFDPAGNELCAFVRDQVPLPDYRIFEVVVDSVDAERIIAWWAELFGVEPQNGGEPWWWLENIPGAPTGGGAFLMDFGPVPEPKTVKNRMHWDVYGDPADFLARGATHLWEVPGRTRPIAWTTLADPEGNEFCVFPPLQG